MPDDSFIYKLNESYKHLPIDYSSHELSEKWTSELNKTVDFRTVQKYVLKNPYWEKPLSDLSKPFKNLYRAKKPLPAELEPFFKSFFELATSSKFKSLFKESEKALQN